MAAAGMLRQGLAGGRGAACLQRGLRLRPWSRNLVIDGLGRHCAVRSSVSAIKAAISQLLPVAASGLIHDAPRASRTAAVA
jgi:hypothetical protein